MLYSFNQYLLILESKREDQLRAKYIDKLGVDELIFDNFYSNKNAEWLLKTYTNIPIEQKNEIAEKCDSDITKILIEYAEMFDNNKDNLETNIISTVKGIDEMKELLDSLRAFDTAEEDYDDDIWVLENTYEWFIFKPTTYEASELANNKQRDSNWCTTYGSSEFDNYLGPQGGMLYVCNKLDKTKDIAIEMSEETINIWNWEDSNTETDKSLEKLIGTVWSEGDEVYTILMDNLDKLIEDIPVIDWEATREKAKNEITDWDLYDIYSEYEYSLDCMLDNFDNDGFLNMIENDDVIRHETEWEEQDNGELLRIFSDICDDEDDEWADTAIDKFKDTFKELMEDTNENNIKKVGFKAYNTNNPSIDEIVSYVKVEMDGKSAIDTAGFEHETAKIIAKEYIDNFNTGRDYIEEYWNLEELGQGYNNIKDRERMLEGFFQWIYHYVEWDDMIDELISYMDNDSLKRYV